MKKNGLYKALREIDKFVENFDDKFDSMLPKFRCFVRIRARRLQIPTELLVHYWFDHRNKSLNQRQKE